MKFYHLDCEKSPEFIRYLQLKKLLINAEHSWLDFSDGIKSRLIDYEISQLKNMCFPKFTTEFFIGENNEKICNKIINIIEQRIAWAKQKSFSVHLFNTALLQIKALTS